MFTRPLPISEARTTSLEGALLGRAFAPRVERYAIRREIARGGMGQVFEAVERTTGCRVALKVLVVEGREGAGRADLERRFESEIAITRSLRGPGVPDVLEDGRTEDGRPFFAMPYLEGQTLEQALEGELGAECGFRVLDDVCDVLRRAHALGIVHRDLKPENVFLAANGETFLIDWGLALRMSEIVPPAERPGSPEGSIGFMPPEQVQGDRSRQTPASDVYGLGALLYTVLGGRKPFADRVGRDSGQALWAIRHEDPTPLCEIPERWRPLAEMCARAMDRDPDRRQLDAAEFQGEFAIARQRFLPLRVSRRLIGKATRQVRLGLWSGLALASMILGVLFLWFTRSARVMEPGEAPLVQDEGAPTFVVDGERLSELPALERLVVEGSGTPQSSTVRIVCWPSDDAPHTVCTVQVEEHMLLDGRT